MKIERSIEEISKGIEELEDVIKSTSDFELNEDIIKKNNKSL